MKRFTRSTITQDITYMFTLEEVREALVSWAGLPKTGNSFATIRTHDRDVVSLTVTTKGNRVFTVSKGDHCPCCRTGKILGNEHELSCDTCEFCVSLEEKS